MQLNPSEISELIKQRIEEFDAGVEARTEGTVVSVNDGIVRIHGLAEVMQGEMIEFPGGEGLLGRVVGSLGTPLDGKGAVDSGETRPIEQVAPGVITRQSVDQP